MKRNPIATLIILLLLSTGIAQAQTQPQIQGKVQDQTTGEPIPYAEAILTPTTENANATENPHHTITTQDGTFQITGVPNGEYTLMIRSVGYDLTTREQIRLTPTQKTHDAGTIQLQPLEIGLAEVVVVGSRRQIVYRLDKRIIEASSNLMGSGGTAVDILENTPSIRVGVDGEVTFRGSSGFKVYVDGQPSFYSGTQALQQVPAGQIENIEVITTPSARYDTDGEVGMINIITKKSSRSGLTGMVNLSGSTALSNGLDFMLAQQRNKLQWHLAGNWNQPVRESDFHQQKETTVGDQITTSTSDGPRRSKGYFYGIRTGIDYAVAPRTSLNAEVDIHYGKNTRTGDLAYSETIAAAGADPVSGDYNSRDDYDLHSTVWSGTVGFAHKFDDGHQLTGSFMAGYEGDAMEYFQSDLFFRGGDSQGSRAQGHRAWEDERRWTVRSNIDYVLPYSETGRLEAGWQYFSYLEDGDYNMQFWDPARQEFYWREDIYNTFYFQRGIHSLYAIGSDSFGPVDAQIGLRGEHTHRVLRSSIEGSNRTVNRFEVFPSLHLGYNLPREQTLTLAYSYRTNRPQLFYMEPYITYRDYYTAEIGNPDIRPEYVNSVELSYKKNMQQHVIQSTVFYRSRRDKIERLRVPYEAGVTLDSMANVGNDHALGLELSAQLKVAKSWDVNVIGNVYYYKVVNDLGSGGRQETSTNYDFTLNNLFRIGRTTRVQFDGNFVGPTVTTQGRSAAFWFANLAVRQQLFSPNLQGTLSFRDVFNSARYRSDITTANLVSITRIRPRYPVITMSLSYTFNNYNRSQSQARDNRDLFEGTNY